MSNYLLLSYAYNNLGLMTTRSESVLNRFLTNAGTNFLPQSAQRFTQSAQRGYGTGWSSSTTEIENALWAATSAGDADDLKERYLKNISLP